MKEKKGLTIKVEIHRNSLSIITYRLLKFSVTLKHHSIYPPFNAALGTGIGNQAKIGRGYYKNSHNRFGFESRNPGCRRKSERRNLK